MLNYFCKKHLWECSQDLCKVAMGSLNAQLVIKNCNLVNVCTHEIIENIDVSVHSGRIAYIGNCDYSIGKDTVVIDAKGKYLAPAFMDGHMHVESSMMTVGEYSKVATAHGTSAIFMDPHEICNVLGLKGVRLMLDDAKRCPLKVVLTTPSCVPAVAGFEDTGAEIHPEDIKETMSWKECMGLGEMMNFPGILSSDKHTHDINAQTLMADKIITGHYSMPETDRGLNAYIASGVRCCHESTREEDAIAKMRLGMYAMLREGSAWHDLHEVSKAITKHQVDSRYACLVSDDSHPNTLFTKGHLDHILRRAVEEGIDAITAIQMVTINVAQCFQIDHEMGSIAPSKCADFVLLDDLKDFNVSKVFIDGTLVAENGKNILQYAPFEYPYEAKHTIHLDKITAKDLEFPCNGKKAVVHAIGIISAKTITEDRVFELDVKNGCINSDQTQDVLKAVVFERHNRTRKKGFGFVNGFGIKNGALAQTIAHDAHNLMVIGTNDDDMALAVNTLIECGGGMVAVKNGKVIGLVPLDIAGLMSEKPLEEMVKLVNNQEKAWKELGCICPSPFMTMSIIPLACIPKLRLTDRGMVDCETFKFVDVIEKIID